MSPIFGSNLHLSTVLIFFSKMTQDDGDPVSIWHLSGHGQPIMDNILNLTKNKVHDVELSASHDVKKKPLLKTSDGLYIADPW